MAAYKPQQRPSSCQSQGRCFNICDGPLVHIRVQQLQKAAYE